MSDQPSAVMLWTNAEGWILESTPDAGHLLNFSTSRHWRVELFFAGDRPRVLRLLDEAARGHIGVINRVEMQPREQRHFVADVIVEPDHQSELIRWTVIVDLATT